MIRSLSAADQRLLAFLVKAGKVDPQRIDGLESSADLRGLTLAEILQTRGILGEEEMARSLAEALRLPLLELAAVPFDEKAAALVKEAVATRFTVVPVSIEKGFLTLAMANPFDQEAVKQIEFSCGHRVRQCIASRSDILRAMPKVFSSGGALGNILAGIPEAADIQLVSATSTRPAREIDVRELTHQAGEAPIVKLVNLVLVDALAAKASDIHVEPGPNMVLVRFRVNGILEEGLQTPKWVQNPMVARIKVMAGADITERRVPQDGRFSIRHAGRMVDVRVSILPTSDGEKVVMRILDPTLGARRLDRIGLSDVDLVRVRKMIAKPEGMILVTGPTGSGKTTTLYAVLQEIFTPEVNVVTIENPVEYELPGVAQVDINERQGLTFAGALRSVLRQDPDVILVGEIRDRETAEVAFEAAQTGHLVLSTLHTNDTAATITRLVDLGLEPYVIASSLVGIVAQRLVRTVCDSCAEPAAIGSEATPLANFGDPSRMRAGKGCAKCRESGYGGREGCYEVMEISKAVQELIESRAQESAIRVLAEEEGMTSLRDDAIAKVREGRTTAAEVTRVIQLDIRGPQCPSCGNAVDSTFTICPYCRTQLRMVCACGMTLKKSWANCPFCGAPTVAVGPSPGAARGNGHAPLETVVARPAESRDEDGAIERPRILVVDDSAESRRFVAAILGMGSPKPDVVEAADGTEALARVAEQPPHLIILDLMMPGIDGFEVCRRLRADLQTAFIPILMLTALEDTKSRSLGFLAGTDDYMMKPVRADEFRSRVGWLLERAYRLPRNASADPADGKRLRRVPPPRRRAGEPRHP